MKKIAMSLVLIILASFSAFASTSVDIYIDENFQLSNSDMVVQRSPDVCTVKAGVNLRVSPSPSAASLVYLKPGAAINVTTHEQTQGTDGRIWQAVTYGIWHGDFPNGFDAICTGWIPLSYVDFHTMPDYGR